MTAILFLACCVMGAAETAPDDAVAYRSVRNRVLLPVTIDDKGPYTFLVDVASPYPVIDAGVAESLGLDAVPESRVEMPGPTGEFVTAYAAKAAVAVGERELEAAHCVVAPLNPLSEWLGVPVHGMLSLAQLGSVVEVDFVAQTITRPDTAPIDGQAAALTYIDGQWHVRALMNGTVAADCVVDLGYGGTCAVPESWARENGLLRPGAARVIIEWGDGAPALAPTGQLRLQNLRLGSDERENLWVDVVSSGAYPRLGAALFAGCRTVWDFAGGVLYIKPEPSDEDSEGALAGYGLALGRHDGNTWRVGVAMPSPASQAGLLGGEKLLAVDGEDVRKASYGDALEALRAEDSTPKAMVFEQDGERIEVELAPASLR